MKRDIIVKSRNFTEKEYNLMRKLFLVEELSHMRDYYLYENDGHTFGWEFTREYGEVTGYGGLFAQAHNITTSLFILKGYIS